MTDTNIPFDPCNEVPIPGEPDPCVNVGRPGPITENEVKCAQKRWCEGLIDISQRYRNNQNYRQAAIDFINRLYNFGPGGRVFFRPTLAKFPNNFRTTFEGTLAYFVGENNNFPDTGFAKKHLIAAVFSNQIEGRTAIQLHGNTAMAMGNVCLTEIVDGVPTRVVVDKAFGYRKDSSNNLKLIVHMSALRNEPGTAFIE